ncbi:nucleotide-binding universal stress UspA family protein [Algoriphagus ratkowskyi]|uniref:Nucleotide-binding universal stress UspA family protein n=1 Tax=Algoriphagus ratkowskyi TaxID=57028 RepID=A0A2W7T9N1_9BACT|nr:universal stress protein [Algoriphagus ratkowskyi]PZX59872.1 nucleotide-binding universal stress UspA family protein [Algoriphagus ratkowskyi]TXD78423.1 universal stress protein [Algoriphagus ratkowskyi]
MKHFYKAMIGLDLTEMDDILIKKTIVYLKFLGIDKCYFVHVAKNLAVPDEILKKHPELLAPGDESIEALITSKLKNFDFPESMEIEVFAEEGPHPLETLLRWAKIKDVDIIIMGRKETLEGSGSIAKGVAKKAPCSVLLLQEKRPPGLPKKIMIPSDFSDHTDLIYTFAERLSEDLGAELMPVHLYEVPHGYSKTGKTFEEFSEIMKDNAQEDFNRFIQKFNHTGLQCRFVLNDGEGQGKALLEEAEKIEADMILLGSRGKTKSAAILLGSVAEKLVTVNNKLPMLIFKRKGETMGFFEALFKV